MIEYTPGNFQFPKDEDYCSPTTAEKREIRNRIYDRDKGSCVVCGVPLKREPGNWWSAHLHHRRGGRHRKDWSDDNLEIRCIYHHNEAHNPKPVPAKE